MDDNLKIINKQFFEDKLQNQGIISRGAYNVVMLVIYNNVKYALRISTNQDSQETKKSYEKIVILYEKLRKIFPKIKEISVNKPYFILYELFDHNVLEYLEDIKDDTTKDELFKNIIDQCIEHIIFVYEQKIHCVDIKPNNFLLNLVGSNAVVKMIDIDDCFVYDDKIEEMENNLFLLMSLYQFYLFFDNKKIMFRQRQYILNKIKEKTTFLNTETKEKYENMFKKIIDYYKYYKYLNHYYKNYNNENVSFDFIWNKNNDSLISTDTLSTSTDTLSSDSYLSPPTKKQKKMDGKRKSKSKKKSKRKSKKKSKKSL